MLMLVILALLNGLRKRVCVEREQMLSKCLGNIFQMLDAV